MTCSTDLAVWCGSSGNLTAGLLIDLGLDELRQVSQRLLPAEIAGLRWNGVRHAGLFDVHLRTDQDFLQSHGHLHLAGQVRIVEKVRVTQALPRDELNIFAAEGVAVTVREVPEGHLECAADLRLVLVHGSSE